MSLVTPLLSVFFFFFCGIFLHIFSRRVSSGEMLDLLKWRAHPERINDSLSKLKEIDGSEIVKVGLTVSDLILRFDIRSIN